MTKRQDPQQPPSLPAIPFDLPSAPPYRSSASRVLIGGSQDREFNAIAWLTNQLTSYKKADDARAATAQYDAANGLDVFQMMEGGE
tara:strand:- start:4430 stop:4687 length:258 start_codon:yes stop_codon:yes gene_type:complete